ncbi:MAG: hypothetical protein WCS42_20160 [Verrucomicrobiota bacterium]
MKMLFCNIFGVVCVLFVTTTLHAATFTYTYDALNRLTNSAYSDGAAEKYLYDPAGNRLSRITLAAASQLDVTPPSVPTNLVANNFTPSQLSIAWNHSYDIGGSGLAGYQIFVNSTFVATTASTNFLLTGLMPNTQYCLTIAAYDHSANVSVQSTQLCLATPVFQPPLLTSPGFLPNGYFQFGITGGTTGPYEVFVSTNLSVWQLWTNLILPIPGNTIDDPAASGFNTRFYQFRWSTNAP